MVIFTRILDLGDVTQLPPTLYAQQHCWQNTVSGSFSAHMFLIGAFMYGVWVAKLA